MPPFLCEEYLGILLQWKRSSVIVTFLMTTNDDGEVRKLRHVWACGMFSTFGFLAKVLSYETGREDVLYKQRARNFQNGPRKLHHYF